MKLKAALTEIRNATESDLNVIYGHTVSVDLEDEMIVTSVATGYELRGVLKAMKSKRLLVTSLETIVHNK